MGTEWSSKINAKIADLAAQRDRWQREWRLLNAANTETEERIKEVEAELTEELDRSILTATVIRENEHLTKENMRLRAALERMDGILPSLQDKEG